MVARANDRSDATPNLLPMLSLGTPREAAPSAPALVETRTSDSSRVRGLFKKHYDGIWRLLRRFGISSVQADDAAQQVFLVLAERVTDVREGSEWAFLYGTALRVATSFRRTNRREVPTPETDTDCTLPRPDELTDRRQARVVLDWALAQLDPELRAVFILYELEEFTTPEIAQLQGIALGTAASRLRRARERFRELLQEFESGRHPGRSKL